MRIAAISAAIVTLSAATLLVAQQPQPQAQPQPQPQPQTQPQTQPAQVQPLSPQAMDALVAGIAFYPDAVIEQILDAAQYPDAIKRAATGTATAAEELKWPGSVRLLTTHREVLRQLDQNAETTARLALAARTQLADVWAAIDRVRKQFESQSQDVATDGTATDGTATASGLVYPTGAFLAGYWTAQVVDEIRVWYAATAPVAAVVYGQGSAVVTGPNGNAATVQHSGSGTYTGQGTGSYSGSTDIESTRGDASIDTNASDGQITSTITTPQGQQTMTLFDDQVGASGGQSAQRTTGAATSSRMARPSSVPALTSPYSHPSLEQWQTTGRRTLANSWGQLSQGTTNFQGTHSLWSNRAVNPQVVQPQFARPTMPGSGGAGALDPLRANMVNPPKRNVNAPGNRAPSGGRRGRR